MQRTPTIFSLMLIWLLFGVTLQVEAAVEPSLKPSDQILTTTDIESLSQTLVQAETLTPEEQKTLTSQLNLAQNWVTESQSYQQQLRALQNRVSEAPVRFNELKASQEKTMQALNNELSLEFNKLPKDKLSQLLNTTETELQQANTNFLNSEKKLRQLLTMATEGSQQIAQLEKRISQQHALQATSNQDVGSMLDVPTRIHSFSLIASLQVLETSLKLINFKMDNLGVLTQLAQTERDYWNVHKKLLLKKVKSFQTLLQNDKAFQATEALQESISAQLNQTNPLYPLQQLIIEAQQLKADLIQNEQQIDQKINAANESITSLQVHFARDKQIVELEGSQETIAQVLHKRLEGLSKIKISPGNALKIKNQLNTSVLNQLLLSEKLADTVNQDLAKQLHVLLGDSLVNLNEEERLQLKQQLVDLHNKFIETAKELQTLYPSYISKLAELNAVTAQQQDKTIVYTRFLNDHLLWLPNVGISGLFSMAALTQSLHWFLSLNNLKSLFEDSLQVLNTHKISFAFWILLIGLLTFARPRFKEGIAKIVPLIMSIRTDSMLYSLQALVFTFGLSILAPLILLGAAALLNQHSDPAEYTQGLIKGLNHAGILVFILGGLKQICRPDGLAERHFRWRASVRNSFQRELGWAALFGTILIIVIDINTVSIAPTDQQMIGRLAFISFMMGLGILIYRLWSPHSEIVRDFKRDSNMANWTQLHFIWFPLLLAIPFSLIWMTVYGYYYSSLVISEHLNWSLGLILSVYILRELLLRSLYLSERKLHYAERVQKHQALQAEKQAKQQATTTEPPTNPDALPLVEEPEMDYSKLSNQVRQALNLGAVLFFLTGIWLIWSDIFPALNLISNSTLDITKSQMINGIVQQVPLTLGDLTLGIALGAMTLLLSKDLPGLLEFTLLRFLPISAAVRYAVSSLTQYVVVIIGLVLIFRALGIEWSNIQWLVAALSVGLGFGLQEIVANFVSGIILLFEQPMRVGDIVTVDGVSGKVSKIRIRATTIINWDRQELIIPNKQMITGQFINWSLSDPITRVKVPVGIAYGSDVNLALQLIQQAADEHPKALKTPAPSVIFDSFGDSALQLELRVFVEDLENFITVKSELHSAINDKLNDADIVIAFPQRDVHLNTSEPLEIHLKREAKSEKASTTKALE
jgi:potassium efflux system protein